MFDYNVTYVELYFQGKDWHHTKQVLSYSFCCVKVCDIECQLHHLCV